MYVFATKYLNSNCKTLKYSLIYIILFIALTLAGYETFKCPQTWPATNLFNTSHLYNFIYCSILD